MKKLLTLIAIFISVSGSAQFYQPYYNSVDWSTDMYVNNSGKPAINAPKVSRAFGSTPNIQANIVGGTPNQFITMTVTTTGFTCTVYQRNTVNLLSVEVLLGTTVLVNNATVHVLITES